MFRSTLSRTLIEAREPLTTWLGVAPPLIALPPIAD